MAITEIPLDHIAQPGRVMAPVRWYGGKGHMARRIMPYLPDGRVYVEPYCGAASVFWYLDPPRPVEVLNDLNGELVNLFRVLQNPETFAEFQHRIIWTPYALDEFRRALAYDGDEPVMRAWAFYVRYNQGFGGTASSAGNWGRVFVSDRGMARTANGWRSRMKLLQSWHDRLTRVQIDNRDAPEVIRYWDGPETVFYVDPPYMHETRATGNMYDHEASDAHHEALVKTLLSLKGQAAVSGYDAPLYRRLDAAGWERVEWQTAAHSAGRRRGSGLQGKGAATLKSPRTEVLWVKRHTHKSANGNGNGHKQAGLFDE